MELKHPPGKHASDGRSSLEWAAKFIFVAAFFITATACQSGSGLMGAPPSEAPYVELLETLPINGVVTALAFSRQGRALAVGGCQDSAVGLKPEGGGTCARGLMQMWNLDGMRLESAMTLPRAITALAVSPDGGRWVAGDSAGGLILSFASTRGARRTLHQGGKITALAFSPDGKWVASGSLDRSFPLGLMDMSTGGVISVKARFGPVTALAFSPDGRTLSVGMEGGQVVLWNFTTAAAPTLVGGAENGQSIASIVFSPDGRSLAAGMVDGKVILWDLGAGLPSVEFKAASSVNSLAFSPDGRFLAIGQDNGKVLLLETKGPTQVWSKRHILPVSDVAYSPDGASLAVAAKQHVYLYHLGEKRAAPGTMTRTESLAGAKAGIPASRDFREASGPKVYSRRLSRVLTVAQDEYVWLLPLDRLTMRAIEAMTQVVPGARIQQAIDAGSSAAVVVRVAGKSLTVSVDRLHNARGREGLREAVRTYETAQRFLLTASPGSGNKLEEVSIAGLLAELGPGVRLVSEPEASAAAARGSEKRNAAGQHSFATDMPDTNSVLLRGKVAYLKLRQFSSQTAVHVREWVAKIANSPRPVEATILDLRDNPGGDFESATAAAMPLMPRGHLLTRVIARKNGDGMDVRSTGAGGLPGNLVVLVNERTAGAAEMLACAIRTSGRGVLVGTRTAGVDDIYTTFPLPGGGGLRVSTGRFICPDDRSVRWTGQAVDVDASHNGAFVAIPIGSSHAESPMALAKWANPFVSNFPLSDDRTLRIGLEVAVCLARSSPYQRPLATTMGHAGELSQAIRLCR